MSMKCDRCGEVFNPEPPDEMGRHKPNAVILVDKNVHDAWDYWSCESYDEPFLCPSCMAKLNDWLKGEQQKIIRIGDRYWEMVGKFKNEDMTPDEFADYITAKSEQVEKELRERWS